MRSTNSACAVSAGEAKRLGEDTDLRAGLGLPRDVADRSGVVSDEDGGEAGLHALGGERRHLTRERVAQLGRDGSAIDDARGHAPSVRAGRRQGRAARIAQCLVSSPHGIDVIEIGRVQAVLDRHGERFLRRVYTEDEVRHCRGRVPELAARFAAKEAVMKALGTGVRGVGWRDIEVLPNRRGKPLVFLYGRGAARAETIELRGLEISLTHSKQYAMASVVGETGPQRG